jgi:hypothetical protein
MNESNTVSLLNQLTDDELNIVAGGARTNADQSVCQGRLGCLLQERGDGIRNLEARVSRWCASRLA